MGVDAGRAKEVLEEEAVLDAIGKIGEPEDYPLEFYDALKYVQDTSPARMRLMYEKWKQHKGITWPQSSRS